jgi:hypothetical protein
MKRVFLLFPVLLFAFAVAAQNTQPQAQPRNDTSSDMTTKGAGATAASPGATTPLQTAQPEASAPSTTVMPEADVNKPTTTTNSDPILDVPPMPKGPVTLIGGIVKSIDRVRQRVTIQPFGGKSMKLSFDERSHIYRDGVETTQMGIHKGDRVYVDTQLDHAAVFARNINVVSETQPADAQGQLLSFNPRSGSMTVRDDLSSAPVTFRIDPSTQIKDQNRPGTRASLVPGSIIAVRFAARGTHDVAREVSVLATPGSAFTFFGVVTHLDLRNGVIAVHNKSDDKTYEIYFNPDATPNKNALLIGSQVTIVATFNGRGYEARNITLNQQNTAEKQPE